MAILIVVGLYTALLTVGVHYYENKLFNLNVAILDYKRAIRLAKQNNDYSHYTNLQLENQELKDQVAKLSQDNDTLKKVAGESKNMQYESSTYKNNTWDSQYANYVELDENPPFIRKYGYKPE